MNPREITLANVIKGQNLLTRRSNTCHKKKDPSSRPADLVIADDTEALPPFLYGVSSLRLSQEKARWLFSPLSAAFRGPLYQEISDRQWSAILGHSASKLRPRKSVGSWRGKRASGRDVEFFVFRRKRGGNDAKATRQCSKGTPEWSNFPYPLLLIL